MGGHTFVLAVVKGLKVMVRRAAHRTAPLPVASSARSALSVVVLALGVSACGDLSQEDLLFRAAVPPKDAIALRVPGAAEGAGALSVRRQALCPDDDLRCTATELAGGFNGLTFVLLDVVDAVVQLPPSQRARGRRVWGPHFDVEKNRSFRFEMVRRDDGFFDFCLHSAAGRVSEREVGDIDCGSDDDVMANIFSGSFQPSDVVGDGARQGLGTMRFEAEKVRRVDGGDRFADVLDFAFDNRDGRVDIDIHAEGVPTGRADVDTTADYSFARGVDGGGEFRFQVFANLVSEGLIPQQNLEHVDLKARWLADQSGRAHGVVSGGDLDDGEEVSVDQCWDADLATFRFENIGGEIEPGDEGTVCAFSEADVVAVD